MPDPLMDTLDEIDRKSGKSGTFLLSPSALEHILMAKGETDLKVCKYRADSSGSV